MRAATSEAFVRAWKPPVPGVREVLHARFTDHAYPPHTHDAWTLFVVDAGSVSYRLDRRACGAEPSMVSLLPPYVVHDGRPGRTGGYRKRVLYLRPEVFGEALIGPAVDRPTLVDARLRGRVSALHDVLARGEDLLEAETRLALVVERIRRVHGAPEELDTASAPDLAEALRAYLDENLTDVASVADAARLLQASPTRLTRAFIGAFGIAPHTYVLGRRLDLARDRILAGQPLAAVAVEAGFFDQAHLTRHFRSFLGVTPGRFAGLGRAPGEALAAA